MSSTFYSAKNFVHGMYKSTLEYVTPVSETSEFSEKGVLTPDEFIKAGNQLVYRCPTWQWEGGHPKKRWSFLPDKQQFLSTKGVPCAQRVRALMGSDIDEQLIEDGEWLATGDGGSSASKKKKKKTSTLSSTDGTDLSNSDDEIAEIGDMSDEEDEDTDEITGRMDDTTLLTDAVVDTVATAAAAGDESKVADESDSESDSFEEIPEMDDFDDTDNLVTVGSSSAIDASAPGAAAATTTATSTSASSSSGKGKKGDSGDDLFVKTRTYDLSIAFDKHYRVPRLWLRGYDENNRPLTSKQIMEDISADHAHKTVTVESHPHLKGVICASIHPCRHSLVMKRFMSVFESQGKEITVEDYMFIFLKFMSGVIPTVDYDYTQTVGL